MTKDYTKYNVRMAYAMYKRGMRVHDLADDTGIRSSTLYCYLNGKRQPMVDKAISIAKALKVSVEWVFSEASEEEAGMAAMLDDWLYGRRRK